MSLTNYRGKVVLIYFGYTFCPDICPTSLANMGQALSALTSKELDQIAAFFISVDHSASNYLVDRDGKLAASLPHGMPPQQMLDNIRKILKP